MNKIFNGNLAFKLRDTHGLPLDLVFDEAVYCKKCSQKIDFKEQGSDFWVKICKCNEKSVD